MHLLIKVKLPCKCLVKLGANIKKWSLHRSHMSRKYVFCAILIKKWMLPKMSIWDNNESIDTFQIYVLYMYLCVPYRNLCSTSCVLPSFDRPQNEVWGKVMFLRLSVSHSVHRGCLPLGLGGVYHLLDTCLDRHTHIQTYPPDTSTHLPLEAPPRWGSHWSGWYASYWYAFLFYIFSASN